MPGIQGLENAIERDSTTAPPLRQRVTCQPPPLPKTAASPSCTQFACLSQNSLPACVLQDPAIEKK